MSNQYNREVELDVLAERAGGYVVCPDDEDIRFMNLFFETCRRFGIEYTSATKKEKCFVDEVTRLTWARMLERESGVDQDVPLAFSA